MRRPSRRSGTARRTWAAVAVGSALALALAGCSSSSGGGGGNTSLPDLPALMARLHPKDAAYISFITGPSRTADIERVLTIGVHGPGRLIIVVVDEFDRVTA